MLKLDPEDADNDDEDKPLVNKSNSTVLAKDEEPIDLDSVPSNHIVNNVNSNANILTPPQPTLPKNVIY